MGYWGWRRLLVFFLSVWVTGCTTTSDTALNIPPTDYPPVTLTVRLLYDSTPSATAQAHKLPTLLPNRATIAYIVEAGDRWETIARRFGVTLAALQAANPLIAETPLLPGQRIVIVAPAFTEDGRPALPTATPPALLAPAPTCYPTTTGTILCYGFVENTLPTVIEQVTVRLYLFNESGEILGDGEAGLELPFLLPGAIAPYHLYLDANSQRYAGVQAVIASARPSDDRGTQLVSLPVEMPTIQIVNDRHYRVSGALVNPETRPVSDVRVVAILYDTAERIASYRIIEVAGSLGAKAARPIEIDVFLPAVTGQVTPVVYALGLSASSD